jgi:hypothetical protein
MCGKGLRNRLKAIPAQSSQPVADESIKVSQNQPGKSAFSRPAMPLIQAYFGEKV